MKNAFIIHGAFGHPKENWIPWLKGEMEAAGYKVVVPTFPTPDGQNYENWMDVMQLHLESFNKQSILVGHSIGAAFALAVLEKIDVTISKTVLNAGFIGDFTGEYIDAELDAINKTIAEREFDWSVIKAHSNSFHILHGEDDPYVPPEKPIQLGKLLEVEPIFIKDGGHLNEKAGFIKFNQLKEIILD